MSPPAKAGVLKMTNDTATYRAVQAVAPGQLERTTKPLREPPPGYVRIRVEACGVRHSDAATVAGTFPISWPRLPGHEVVGHWAWAGTMLLEPKVRSGASRAARAVKAERRLWVPKAVRCCRQITSCKFFGAGSQQRAVLCTPKHDKGVDRL